MNDEVLNKAPIDYIATSRIAFVRCKKTALLALCQQWEDPNVCNTALWVRVPTLDLTLTDK